MSVAVGGELGRLAISGPSVSLVLQAPALRMEEHVALQLTLAAWSRTVN